MGKVIIIGAGIVGASAAYELAQKGFNVTLIDEHADGRATSAAADIICPWVTRRRNKAWYELARKGAAYIEQLISELHADGERDTGYKKIGAMRLHTEVEKLHELKEIACKRREIAPQIGELTLLSEKETQEKLPMLNGTYSSLFIEGAARVDGRALRDSLISAAKKYGAIYIKGKANINSKQNKITGVEVGEKNVHADMVIATNGVWMPQLLKPLGINLNITAQKGEIIHLQTDTIDTSSLPVVMPPNNQYMLHFDRGKMVIGASHAITDTLTTNITAGGIHYILDEALKVAPGISNFSIVETRVGFRPFTFNHLPIFGKIPEINGLLVANGLGASGLTTGPFIGKQLAALVEGSELDVKLDAYRVEQALK